MGEKMGFAAALERLKQGARLRRLAWSEILWVALMPALFLEADKVNDRTRRLTGDEDLDCQPYLVAMTESGRWCPGWQLQVADLLAEDWVEY